MKATGGGDMLPSAELPEVQEQVIPQPSPLASTTQVFPAEPAAKVNWQLKRSRAGRYEGTSSPVGQARDRDLSHKRADRFHPVRSVRLRLRHSPLLRVSRPV